MNGLLIHGCYDSTTLETLKGHGIKNFSFDLRGKSRNLVTFKELRGLLQKLSTEKIFLTFGDEKKETIESYLNLLSTEPFVFTLIFREERSASFYKEIEAPFYWMFHPDEDWQKILQTENLKGVLLPLKYHLLYHRLPDLWQIIDTRNIDVFLHADTFEETLMMNLSEDFKLSIDISPEVERNYRNVDQEKLRTMKIWRCYHENSSGQ